MNDASSIWRELREVRNTLATVESHLYRGRYSWTAVLTKLRDAITELNDIIQTVEDHRQPEDPPPADLYSEFDDVPSR